MWMLVLVGVLTDWGPDRGVSTPALDSLVPAVAKVLLLPGLAAIAAALVVGFRMRPRAGLSLLGTLVAILVVGTTSDTNLGLILTLFPALPLVLFLLGRGLWALAHRVRRRSVRAALLAMVLGAWDFIGPTHGALTALLAIGFLFTHVGRGLWAPWADARSHAAAAAIWTLALFSTFAGWRLDFARADRRGDTIAAACRQYKADHGRLPATLDELTPLYLPRLPLARWAPFFTGFVYVPGDGSSASKGAWFGYVDGPPMLLRCYSLEQDRWHFVKLSFFQAADRDLMWAALRSLPPAPVEDPAPLPPNARVASAR
jgi:hypothetical protein